MRVSRCQLPVRQQPPTPPHPQTYTRHLCPHNQTQQPAALLPACSLPLPALYSCSEEMPDSRRSWKTSSMVLTGTPSMRVVRTLWCCSAMLVRLHRGRGRGTGRQAVSST